MTLPSHLPLATCTCRPRRSEMGCSLEHELGLHLTNQARTSSNLVAALAAMLTRAHGLRPGPSGWLFALVP